MLYNLLCRCYGDTLLSLLLETDELAELLSAVVEEGELEEVGCPVNLNFVRICVS